MSASQSNKNRICRQSSDIELKTIVDENTVSLLDAEKAIKCDQDHVNREQSNGINIKFQDIIYRARRNIIWDRCKCNGNCRRFIQFIEIYLLANVLISSIQSAVYFNTQL